MAVLAKRIVAESSVAESSPAEIATALALGVVTDIEARLSAVQTAAEQIRAARAPLAFDASRGDADAVTRLADLTRASAENAQQVSDLTVALTEARERLGCSLERQRCATPPMMRSSPMRASSPINSSRKASCIDDALRTVAAAHRERQRLGSRDCAERLLARSRSTVLARLAPRAWPARSPSAKAQRRSSRPGQPPFTGAVSADF